MRAPWAILNASAAVFVASTVVLAGGFTTALLALCAALIVGLSRVPR